MTKEVRPTSGKVMGALFNILGNLDGRAFLDLFSGTGRVARSAVDRGAVPVVAVEIIPSRAREIRSLLPEEPACLVLSMDVRRALSFLRRKGYRPFPDEPRGFDVIFADPPYGAGWPSILGGILFPQDGGLLNPGGIVVIEHSIREEAPAGERYMITDRREYGETVLTFLSPVMNIGTLCGKRGEEE
jgi:16S rRNA G966 N2-methylase RsmD